MEPASEKSGAAAVSENLALLGILNEDCAILLCEACTASLEDGARRALVSHMYAEPSRNE